MNCPYPMNTKVVLPMDAARWAVLVSFEMTKSADLMMAYNSCKVLLPQRFVTSAPLVTADMTSSAR